MAEEQEPKGFIGRTWSRLTSPSAKWSVLALVVIGLIIGAAAVIGTQVMVTQTGTNEFCGTACHSMQWVAAEYRQSKHHANRTGVAAGCHDCHVPHAYPELLWYKAKAGLRDAIAQLRGTIGTEEKFKKERGRLAQDVWAEFKANDSENCRHCHSFTPETLAKQNATAREMHAKRASMKMTCIDCHKGVAHSTPE